MKRIFVTGANGFLGTALVKKLISKYRVRALVRDRKKGKHLKELGAEIVCGDLGSKKLPGFVAGCDVVCHLAALKPTSGASEKEYMKANTDGTKQLVSACTSAKVGKIIYASTVLVYGPQDLPVLDETCRCNPRTPYAKSKYAGEQAVRNSGLPYTILRFGIMYGPADYSNIANLIERIKTSKVVPTVGTKLHFIYIDDAAESILRCIDDKRSDNRVYNVVAGEPTDFSVLIGVIEKNLGKEVMKIRLPKAAFKFLGLVIRLIPLKAGLSPEQIETLCADQAFDGKEIRKIGFAPRTAIKEGIRKTMRS